MFLYMESKIHLDGTTLLMYGNFVGGFQDRLFDSEFAYLTMSLSWVDLSHFSSQQELLMLINGPKLSVACKNRAEKVFYTLY